MAKRIGLAPVVEDLGDGLLNVKIKCHICKEVFDIQMTKQQFEDYMSMNGYIQDIFPELSPEDRELLISNTCDKCFTKLFEGDDYE